MIHASTHGAVAERCNSRATSWQRLSTSASARDGSLEPTYSSTKEFRRYFLQKLRVVKELYPTRQDGTGRGRPVAPPHVPARVAGQLINVAPPK